MRAGAQRRDHQGGQRDANFSFPVNGLFPLIGDEPPRRGRPSRVRNKARARAREVLEQLDGALRGLRVVGPFRRPPERRYEYQGVAATAVDATGRDVVDALIESSIRRGRGAGRLVDAVNRWLEKVARVKLDLTPIGETSKLFEVRLRDLESGRWSNYADVGFGIGQALPVFVEGLRTPEGGTFVVQEPEIHLHPDAQLAMADFLIDLMRSGRQVLIETHSEHLLLRLRRRIVAGTKDGISPEQLSMIHVAKQASGASQVVELAIDEMGQIQRWPAGFMEEANEERMALLEAMSEHLGPDADG